MVSVVLLELVARGSKRNFDASALAFVIIIVFIKHAHLDLSHLAAKFAWAP